MCVQYISIKINRKRLDLINFSSVMIYLKEEVKLEWYEPPPWLRVISKLLKLFPMEYPIVSLRPLDIGTSLRILPRLTRKPVWLSKHELEMCSDDSSDWPNLKKCYIHLLVLDLGWCKIVLRRVLERSFSQRELPRCTYRPVPDFYSLPYWFLLVLIIDLNTANVSKEARAPFFR